MKQEMKQDAVSNLVFINFYIQVNDAMEMGMDNVDEQADDVYNGILGEIGLEYQMQDGVRNLFPNLN